MALTLYSYFRSSTSFRVRIALALKGLAYQTIPIHLLKDGGEHKKPDYLNINPQGLVPALDVDGHMMTQSMAILDWLEQTHPHPALLPSNPQHRAYVYALSMQVASDIHPLNNPRVLQQLVKISGREEDKMDWMHHWMHVEFKSLEAKLLQSPVPGWYALGDTPSWADVCLIPQIYNALRFNVEMKAYPRMVEIYEMAMAQPAFQLASPEAQKDAYE